MVWRRVNLARFPYWPEKRKRRISRYSYLMKTLISSEYGLTISGHVTVIRQWLSKKNTDYIIKEYNYSFVTQLCIPTNLSGLDCWKIRGVHLSIEREHANDNRINIIVKSLLWHMPCSQSIWWYSKYLYNYIKIHPLYHMQWWDKHQQSPSHCITHIYGTGSVDRAYRCIINPRLTLPNIHFSSFLVISYWIFRNEGCILQQ